MKRIKELDVIVYEVKDLKGNALDNAVNTFIEECIMMSGTTEVYNSAKDELIEAIEDNEYYFDQEGKSLSLYHNNSDNNICTYYFTNALSVDVTLEDI